MKKEEPRETTMKVACKEKNHKYQFATFANIMTFRPDFSFIKEGII